MTSRLFVAIWPDDAARAELIRIVGRAREAAPDVRWQPPERWHITLAFLGQSDPEKASTRIATQLSGGSYSPEPIRVADPGAFGPVVWLGIDHGPWLTQLAGELQRTLRVADRRFRAHLTVGRVRGADGPARARSVASLLALGATPALAPRAAPLLAPRAAIEWTPGEITLVESMTGPTPSYRVLNAWPLHPAGPAPRPRTTARGIRAPAMPDSSAPKTLEGP